MSQIWQIYTSSIKIDVEKLRIQTLPSNSPSLIPWSRNVCLELSYLEPPLWKIPGSAPASRVDNKYNRLIDDFIHIEAKYNIFKLFVRIKWENFTPLSNPLFNRRYFEDLSKAYALPSPVTFLTRNHVYKSDWTSSRLCQQEIWVRDLNSYKWCHNWVEGIWSLVS